MKYKALQDRLQEIVAFGYTVFAIEGIKLKQIKGINTFHLEFTFLFVFFLKKSQGG